MYINVYHLFTNRNFIINVGNAFTITLEKKEIKSQQQSKNPATMETSTYCRIVNATFFIKCYNVS